VGNLSAVGLRLALGERILLESFDLSVGTGELLAVVGPNGVGKTTLLRTLAGFLTPAAGTVLVDGRPLSSFKRDERARALTLLGGDTDTPHGMSLRDVVLTGRFARRPWWDWATGEADLFAADAALERAGLAALRERDFDRLSSGERQRGWLALALAQDASTILLDEPTSHLDVRHAAEVTRLLRGLARDGRSVVAVLHDLNEAAAIADRIAVLGEGRLLTCATPERALDPGILERAFGIPFQRIPVGRGVRVLPLD
jgi:ABC-type cobalamin/Fe3+-siderophores transport system ATPase subunit